MKISILTLGCRTNQAESAHIERGLQEAGHEIVRLEEKPELCIVNTCTVTSSADIQSRNLIRKASRSGSRVIATGCYVELNKGDAGLRDVGVELVSNLEKHNLIKLIAPVISSNDSGQYSPSRHRPNVKVQDGCNYSCSYCAIPFARGRSRSVLEKDVIEGIQRYETIGCHEIVLTGIHLASYGLDMSPKSSLAALINKILLKTSIKRIRLSSISVNNLGDDILELFDNKRICQHLHIPLQSGDDSVLRLMNRPYSSKQYLCKIDRILDQYPDIAIGTDVIVGFPEEDDQKFINTYNMLSSIPLAYLHVFPYSPRPGTKAYCLKNMVNKKILKDRVAQLRVLGADMRFRYNSRNIDKIMDIIIEEASDECIVGTTGNFIKVYIEKTEGINMGMLLDVRISELHEGMTKGTEVQ
jgi:threonylcarbamoyladenosine tRNA methylthiotransferase MtaB